MPETKRSVERIKSVHKAIQVLELLAKNKGGMRLVDIAKALQFSQTSTFNILATLEDAGYATQDPRTLHYKLGIGVIYLAQSIEDIYELSSRGKRLIGELASDIGETVQFAVLGQMESIITYQVKSSNYLSITVNAGDRFPLHTSASGKAFMAFAMNRDEVEKVIQERGLSRFTDKTITSREALLAELERIRTQGYAIEDEEYAEYVQGVAVPVRGRKGEFLTALTMAGLKTRTHLPDNPQLIQKMIRCAEEISADFGRR